MVLEPGSPESTLLYDCHQNVPFGATKGPRYYTIATKTVPFGSTTLAPRVHAIMRLPAKAYHFGTNEGAPGPPSRAPPPAAWARAQRERDKRGLALAPRVHAIIRLPPKAYHLATNEGAPGPPPRAPPPAAWQRERDSLLALWATLMRGLHHAPMLSCLVGYRHARASLSPTRHAFLPCGLPSRVGYSHPRADAFLPCGLPSCVGCTHAPNLCCPVGYRHARATLSPARRCLLALWATLMRGPRSLSKPP